MENKIEPKSNDYEFDDDFEEFEDIIQNTAIDLLDEIENNGTPTTIINHVREVAKMAYYAATGEACAEFSEEYIREPDYEWSEDEINDFCDFMNTKIDEIKSTIDDYMSDHTITDIYNLQYLNHILSMCETIKHSK